MARTIEMLRNGVTVEGGIAQQARRYLLAEAWTWNSPTQRAAQRSSWAMWRRIIRPLGAAAWWTGVLLSWTHTWFFAAKTEHVVATALVAITLSCITYGLVDGVRWRARRRAIVADPPSRRAPALGPGAERDTEQGG